jgi:dynactin complex subunit
MPKVAAEAQNIQKEHNNGVVEYLLFHNIFTKYSIMEYNISSFLNNLFELHRILEHYKNIYKKIFQKNAIYQLDYSKVIVYIS